MRSLSSASLFAAGGLTLLLTPMVLGNLHPWGTRGALASVQWLVFCTPRWLCLALALGTGLQAGRFRWVPLPTSAHWLVLAGAHLGIGLASLFCLAEMSETGPPVPLWLRGLAALVSLAVPTVIISFLAVAGRLATTNPPPSSWWRGALAACVLVGAVTGVAVGWREHVDTQKLRRKEAARAAERHTQEQATLTQLDRLAPDAPVEQWLPFTAMVGMPAVTTRARDAIRARPHLTFDLVGCLRRDDAPTRALVLDFVRGGGLPALAADSIPEAREALGAEVAAMRTRAEAQPDVSTAAFDPECLEAVFLVARYPGHEGAFVETLREMRAVLDQLPKTEPLPAGQEELDRWLRLNGSDGMR